MMMSEQQFSARWQQIDADEASTLAQREKDERARMAARIEKISDKVKAQFGRARALVIHEALTPDERGSYIKQERLAELTAMALGNISQYASFGHFISYFSRPEIKPTLLQPLFFEHLTLTHFLRLLEAIKSEVGPRSKWSERMEDYERRFRKVIEQVNGGTGQPLGREEIYVELEKLAGRKKPTLLAVILQHLEQLYPDRIVTAKRINEAIGSFKKKADFYTETMDSAQGPALRLRKICKINPAQAQDGVSAAQPLLEEIIELASRSTARTSLCKISANAQQIQKILKNLQAWAETRCDNSGDL